MWGFYLGVAVAIGLLTLALLRPVMARMGWGYAFERRRQLALVVAGLMVGTTVIAAAGIAADSSGESFSRSVTSRITVTDAVLSSWDGSVSVITEEMDAIADDPRLAPHVAASSAGLRRQMAFEAQETGRGDSEVTIWGIDPASFRQVAAWEAEEGTAPGSEAQWADAFAVINDRAAKQFGLAVGDGVNLFVGGDDTVFPVGETFDGHLVLSAESPLVGLTGSEEGYIHHPDDVYNFTWVQTHDAVGDFGSGEWEWRPFEFTLRHDGDATLVLQVLDPGRELYEATSTDGVAHITVPGRGYGQDSIWEISVHSDAAQDLPFNVTVTAFAEGVTEATVHPLTVGGIIEQEGSDPIQGAAVVYVPLGALQSWTAADDRVNTLLIDFGEDAPIRELREPFDQAAQEHFPYGYAQMPLLDLEDFRREIELITQATFLGFGSFTIIAGFMLIGVLMALLVEERKRLIATSRAIGASRGHVTEAISHEGSVYALLASFVGLIGAVGLAALVMRAGRTLLGEEGIEAVLIVRIGTILAAIGAGFAITMLVMAIAAYMTTRLQVAAALRGEEQEPRQGRWLRWTVIVLFLLAGLLFTASAVLVGSNVGLVAGPCLLAFGLLALMSRSRFRNQAFSTVGASLTVYLIASFWFIEVVSEVDFILFPVRAVLLPITLGLVAAYSSWLHAGVVALFSRIKGLGPLVDSALAHLRARPGRSALTIIMFAVVLVMLTTLGTMFATFTPNDLGDAGGFRVVGDTPIDLGDPQQYLADNPPTSGIDPFQHMTRYVATPILQDGVNEIHMDDPEGIHSFIYAPFAPRIAETAVGVTPTFADAARFESVDAPGYGSARAAFEAVSQDPGLVIISSEVIIDRYDGENDRDLPDERFEPGMVVDLGWSNNVYHTLRVAGVVHNSGAGGMFVHPDVIATMATENGLEQAGTRIWADPEGVTPEALGQELESAFRRAGMDATDVENIDSEDAEFAKAFQFIITLFMGLGILIGMVSLALIMGRNVILRKAEIGTFRAMGARPGQIIAMFGFEALYLTAFAIMIGFSIGLLVAGQMITVDEGIWVDLKVDWANLAGLYLITLGAAVAAAFLPAWRASRIPPAEAVRYVE